MTNRLRAVSLVLTTIADIDGRSFPEQVCSGAGSPRRDFKRLSSKLTASPSCLSM